MPVPEGWTSQHLPSALGGGWGHSKASGDIPKLLGPGAMVTIALYLNPRQGEQGCAPTVGDRPVAQLWDLLWGAVAIGSSGDRRRVLWLPGEGGLGADETKGLQGGQGAAWWLLAWCMFRPDGPRQPEGPPELPTPPRN